MKCPYCGKECYQFTYSAVTRDYYCDKCLTPKDKEKPIGFVIPNNFIPTPEVKKYYIGDFENRISSLEEKNLLVADILEELNKHILRLSERVDDITPFDI